MIQRLLIVLGVIIGIGLLISLFIIYPVNTVMCIFACTLGGILAIILCVSLYNYIFHGRFTPSLE